jgi:subfamily B ATP-binding cassette protein MsbA
VGKTTLVNLLPRFFDVTAGRICINGTDIRDMTLASLRSRIGLVTQETFLFNDTVANNLSYGAGDVGPDEITTAARRAHAHDFIEQMPDGYETLIGERGVRLSGGQRQRLAIARAILRNPPILVLDEATSALDTESERLVQAALDELMVGRTVFAIAHRLSTLGNCNRIVVLDAGQIVEQGTHEELLAAGGIYKRLYDLQFG